VSSLGQELLQRCVENAVELVQEHSDEKIREQIENFDDRVVHGEKLSPGWLRCAIESEKGYGFRKGFRSTAQREEDSRRRLERDREKAAQRESEKRFFEIQRSKDEASFERFLAYRDSFDPSKQIELEDEALKMCNTITRHQVLKARRGGSLGMFHQLLWEEFIMRTPEADVAITGTQDP
ncbi:MAG: hypothetical protein ACR2NZ_10210, partial [Rubripirellula sp.]